jgi:hypothetical protein
MTTSFHILFNLLFINNTVIRRRSIQSELLTASLNKLTYKQMNKIYDGLACGQDGETKNTYSILLGNVLEYIQVNSKL